MTFQRLTTPDNLKFAKKHIVSNIMRQFSLRFLYLVLQPILYGLSSIFQAPSLLVHDRQHKSQIKYQFVVKFVCRDADIILTSSIWHL